MSEVSRSGTRQLTALDIVAFLVEIAAIVVLAVWGFLGWAVPWNVVIGIGAPVIALVVWALFVSPRSVFAVHPFIRALVELSIYASATIALWDMGAAWAGLGYGVIAVTIGLLTGRRRLS